MEKIERWNHETKVAMFIGIILLTLGVFLGNFYLFFVVLDELGIIGSFLCTVATLCAYNEAIMPAIKNLIEKYRYKD